MEKILFVNACPRPESRTLELARFVLSGLSGEAEEMNVFENGPDALDWESLQLRDSLIESGNFDHPMLAWARQFAAADTIVIAAPFWDLLFPAKLRCYLESVTVTGLTFRYSDKGVPQSMCRAKKLIYVSTAGGPTAGMNFGFDYINALARGLYGVEDVKCIMAEGLDIWGADVSRIMGDAKRRAEELLS